MKNQKIYLNKAKEDWIIDRATKEWNSFSNNTSRYIFNSDIVWLIAPWLWKKVNKKYLKDKKVVCSIYHIDEDKFNDTYKEDFYERDKFVDAYHVISKITENQVRKLTDKQIFSIPFWLNQDIYFEIKENNHLLKKYGLENKKYLIGSFQRDTEGEDLISPKLSKGPDRFVELVQKIQNKREDVHVVLAGHRRQFVIEELKKRNINYSYFEMVNFIELNELYNCLDLYIVASRFEGGPQSILECANTKTPIVSTNVGVAAEILHPDSIFTMDNFFNAKPNIDFAYRQVQKYLIPQGIDSYMRMFSQI